MASRKRVVIVGGGVAGLDLAVHLARRFVVTLVDREPAYIWKPILHTIAAGTRDAHLEQTTYLAQAARHGFTFQPGEVASLDRVERRVTLGALVLPGHGEILPKRALTYDALVVATGSSANDFGTPGVTEFCRRIDSRRDAVAVNGEISIGLLKSAGRGEVLNIGIVGGGATGVELAAELVRLVDLAAGYGGPGRERLRITLLEMSGLLLTGFPLRIQEAARRRLESLGVLVKTGAAVASVEASGFRLKSGELVVAQLKLWAAGVKGSLSSLEGLEVNNKSQLIVTEQLRSTGDSAIFGLGDCAACTLHGEQLPPTAQVASQQAKYLAKYMPALMEGRDVRNFVYHDFGALVSLGGYDAYGTLGKFGFFKGGFIKGKVAQIGHAMLYRKFRFRLNGVVRGMLLWLADSLERRVRPKIRLD